MPRIVIDRLDPNSIDRAIRQVEDYGRRVERAAGYITEGLAQIGYEVAASIMAGHVWSGETIESLTVEEVEENKYILYAESTAILFFEFGAGVRYGGGHPWDGELGMGPGTYPGQKHAFDEGGWWFPTDDPRLILRTDKSGQGWGHSYGNPPHMPFYTASVNMRNDILRLAKEALM